jgi:SAM-dependent methyltransferase
VTTSGDQSWEGGAYSAESAHHRAFDDWFLEARPPGSTDRVVDAGCGSGEFTVRLASIACDGQVIGVDPDASMLDAARAKVAANLEFRPGSIEHLDDVCEHGWADLVVSRAVFHWIPPDGWGRAYAAVHRVLRPGGFLHAESGGAGNVFRVVALMDDVAEQYGLPPAQVTFPQPGAVMELLEQTGFEVGPEGVTTVAQRRPFDRERLRGFLRTQASQAYVGGAPPDVRDAFVRAIDERIEELRRHDGTYDQTFVRLHVLARRPE